MNSSNEILKNRFFAFLLDMIFLGILDTVVSIFITEKGLFSFQFQKMDIYLLPKITIIAYVYYAVLESTNLQASLGKKIMGLKVVDMVGNKLSFLSSCYRSFIRLISLSIFGLGAIIAFFNSDRLTFHDKVTKTYVVM
jgi:uncharacterized RDD family membrane protein YckC